MALSWTMSLDNARVVTPAQQAAAALTEFQREAIASGQAATTAGEQALKAAGAFRDAAGRMRGSNGRFLTDAQVSQLTGGLVQTARASSQLAQATTGILTPAQGAAKAKAQLAAQARASAKAKQEAAARAKELEGRLDGLRGGAARAGSGMMAMIAVMVSMQAAMGALHLAAEGVGKVFELQGFKENALFGFQVLEKTAEGASALLDRADMFARALGTKTTSVAETFRELRFGGFTQQQSEAVVSGLADLMAANPKANIQNIATQMTQMMGKGKIVEEDLKPIRNSGLQDDILWQVLREMTGIKDQKALTKKLQSQTGVSADIGFAAILETIRRQSGEETLGQLANKRSRETVGGAVDNLKAMWERLIIYVNTSALGGQIARVANQLAVMIDPSTESGQRFVRMIERATMFAGRLIDSFDTGSMGRALDMALKFGDALERYGGPLITGVMKGLGEGFDLLVLIWSKLNPMLKPASFDWEKIGLVIAYAATAVAILTGAALMLLPIIFRTFQGIGEFIGQMYDLGVAIIEGFWNGMIRRWRSLIEGFKSLVAMLPEGVRKVLGIASPSKVMYGLGVNTTEGFAMGLNARMTAVEAASRRLAFEPLAPAAGPALVTRGTTGGRGLATGGGGGAPTITVTIGEVHLHISTSRDAADLDGEAIAARAATMLANEIFDRAVAGGRVPPPEPLE